MHKQDMFPSRFFTFDDAIKHEELMRVLNTIKKDTENIIKSDLTSPPPFVPEEFMIHGLEDEFQNTIESYRSYYKNWVTENNAKWGGIVENMRTPPSWIIENANI